MTLLGLIETAEQGRKGAADRLAEAEAAQSAAARALKEAEAALHEMREERVRLEGGLAQANAVLETLTARAREKLDCAPEEALALAQHDPSDELPERTGIETKLERLIRERENIGPVNLRAEAEAAELDQQITGLQTERSDLVAAIARLRQGIASLNREGRERLLAAFEQVNRHFQDLFVRLFGGGRAHLALTESEDPLEAGLEIMASPPGKRLQVMSLLSGGEQALTALALLFAVFLTNPAPICVLDEVDAPLDDANVDRFCTLVEDIAKTSETRFLIITHHRLTMARMDRLFGVTMAERGVSQLVSVDLQRAERLAATA
jgi:chromosome segregation protein